MDRGERERDRDREKDRDREREREKEREREREKEREKEKKSSAMIPILIPSSGLSLGHPSGGRISARWNPGHLSPETNSTGHVTPRGHTPGIYIPSSHTLGGGGNTLGNSTHVGSVPVMDTYGGIADRLTLPGPVFIQNDNGMYALQDVYRFLFTDFLI